MGALQELGDLFCCENWQFVGNNGLLMRNSFPLALMPLGAQWGAGELDQSLGWELRQYLPRNQVQWLTVWFPSWGGKECWVMGEGLMASQLSILPELQVGEQPCLKKDAVQFWENTTWFIHGFHVHTCMHVCAWVYASHSLVLSCEWVLVKASMGENKRKGQYLCKVVVKALYCSLKF